VSIAIHASKTEPQSAIRFRKSNRTLRARLSEIGLLRDVMRSTFPYLLRQGSRVETQPAAAAVVPRLAS